MKIAVVGDHYASYIKADYNHGIKGCPAWDIELKETVEDLIHQDFDKIYLSCGFPLMGFKKHDEAIGASARIDSFIAYDESERGFYSCSNWRKIIKDESTVAMLWAAWRRAVDDLYGMSENIWILPIALYWYELRIKEKIPRIYADFGAKYSRWVNVPAVIQGDKFKFQSRYGRLTPETVKEFEEVLNNG
ncbi:MAG: hypothetical protein WBA93_28510 [Microcoleaceae cyanobacterium]